MTTTHPLSAVLLAAADEVDGWEQHKAACNLRTGAGGVVFCLLFEQSKQMYGWTAIEHLQKQLGAALPHGQIQHWQESDRVLVAKALRDAANQPVDTDVEVVALRAKLADFHERLAEASGWLSYNVSTLVTEVTDRMRSLEADRDRKAARIAESEQENAKLRTELAKLRHTNA